MHARIDAIGASEMAEARQVLQEDHYLPDAAEHDVYVEFAAVFLELRDFDPTLLNGVFPAVRDPQRVERVLAQDLDIDRLLAGTRLPGAPSPQAGNGHELR